MSKFLQIPDEMNDDLLEILGMPNFVCGPIAHVMQAAGADIPKKSESEQAHVLLKLLSFYAQHGPGWRQHAAEWLGETQAVAKARALRRERDSMKEAGS